MAGLLSGLRPGNCIGARSQQGAGAGTTAPCLACYSGDCVGAVAAGLVRDQTISLVDCDPWGLPWDALTACFGAAGLADRVALAVTDGASMARAVDMVWGATGEFVEMVKRYGESALRRNYEQVSFQELERLAKGRDMIVSAWKWLERKGSNVITWAAILERGVANPASDSSGRPGIQ